MRLGEHCLARARRANHQQIVPARGGERQRPFGHFLATDVGKVDVVAAQLVEQFVQTRRGRFQRQMAGEKRGRLC